MCLVLSGCARSHVGAEALPDALDARAGLDALVPFDTGGADPTDAHGSVDAGSPHDVPDARRDAGMDAGAIVCPDGIAATHGLRLVVMDDVAPFFGGPDPDRLRVFALDDPAASFRDVACGETTTAEAVGASHQVVHDSIRSAVAWVELDGDFRVGSAPLDGRAGWREPAGFAATSIAVVPTGLLVIGGTLAEGLGAPRAALFDPAGRMLFSSTVLGGFDVAVDQERGVVWVVGATVLRAPLDDLDAVEHLVSFGYLASSVDVGLDGTVWITERRPSLMGRVFALDPSGAEVTSVELDADPSCVRVHPSTGDVWVATDTGLVRLPAGDPTRIEVLHPRPERIWALAPDPSGDAVWAAVWLLEELVLIGSDGAVRRTLSGVSASRQKSLAIVP